MRVAHYHWKTVFHMYLLGVGTGKHVGRERVGGVRAICRDTGSLHTLFAYVLEVDG